MVLRPLLRLLVVLGIRAWLERHVQRRYLNGRKE
jgi:hypothetical protein